MSTAIRPAGPAQLRGRRESHSPAVLVRADGLVLGKVGPRVWRVWDTEVSAGEDGADERRLLGVIEGRSGTYELTMADESEVWPVFGSIHDALVHLLSVSALESTKLHTTDVSLSW